jgi:hypothetical protein
MRRDKGEEGREKAWGCDSYSLRFKEPRKNEKR